MIANNANGLDDTSKFEGIENPLLQDDINLMQSSTVPSQFDNNVSRSYVISEENSSGLLGKFVEDNSTIPGEFDFNVSRSYVISDNKSEINDGNAASREAMVDTVVNKLSVVDIAGDQAPMADCITVSDIAEPVPHDNLTTLEDPSELKQCDGGANENVATNANNVVTAEGVNEDDIGEKILGGCEIIDDEVDEQSPPSLRSIKSIAEERKKKLLQNERDKAIQSDTNSKIKSRPVEGNVCKNRSSKLTMLKENIKKGEEKRSSKVPKKNFTLAQKTLNNVKASNKKSKTDFGIKFKHSAMDKGDPLKTEIHQLQMLNERERRSNVKIYQNLTASQRKWKCEKEKLCSDYEKRIEELNLKVVSLENKTEVILQNTGGVVDGNLLPTLSADDIKNLTKQLELQESMISGFQLENERLYNKVKDHDATMEAATSKHEVEKKELLESLETLKMKYHVDQEKLQKKLKWYAENQLLLDKDMNESERRREDTKNLRTLVERLEADAKKLMSENTELKEELNNKINAAAKNSTQGFVVSVHSKANADGKLSQVILPGDDKNEMSPIKENDRPMYTFLEKRIKILENELEEKDLHNARKIRAIEQKYSVLTLEYEEHVKQLERKVTELDVDKSAKESNVEVENQLIKMKSEHSSAIHDLRQLIDVKEAEISTLILKLEEKSKKDSEKNFKPISVLQKQVDALKKKLKFKDAEINELTNNILLLEKDRRLLIEELQKGLSEKELEYIPNQCSLKTDATVVRKDYTELEAKYSALLDENKDLKQFLEELQIDGEGKRLRYEALEAKSQNEVRNLREKYEEDCRESDDKYQKTIERMKMEFAVEHSNSKVAVLNGKVTGYELMIEHMKNTIEEVRIDKNRFTQMKVTEESLQQKISHLQRELMEAQNFDVPEIRHYKMLEAKINIMEKNHYSREEKLQAIIESTKGKALADVASIEEKWQEELRKKDTEIENFRLELDSIIEVLQELQKQGVILTKYDVNLPP